MAYRRDRGVGVVRAGVFGAAVWVCVGRAIPAPSAVEKDQRAVVGCEVDLCAVPLLAAIVGPFAGAELALEVDFGAFLQVLLGELSKALAEDDDAVPFGPLDAVAALVFPAFAGGDDEGDDASAVASGANFGVAAEVADQLHAVEIAGHVTVPSFPLWEGRRPRAGVVPSGAVERDRDQNRPSPSAATGAGAQRHGSARAGGASRAPKRGCGSGTETGLDRGGPREPDDDAGDRARFFVFHWLLDPFKGLKGRGLGRRLCVPDVVSVGSDAARAWDGLSICRFCARDRASPVPRRLVRVGIALHSQPSQSAMSRSARDR